MNRRDSLRFIGVGSITMGAFLESCKPDGKDAGAQTTPASDFEVLEHGREGFEIERDKKLLSEKFFDEHEMATIAILADIIIPKDEKSGSATDAGVPDFIEFIVKDIPSHQVPMRGGLRWLDMECYNRFETAFVDCTQAQRMEIVDEIAWPKKGKPEMMQGVAFFNRMRDLTATGFYTTDIGLEDIGYMGNRPNDWPGVPKEELDRLGISWG